MGATLIIRKNQISWLPQAVLYEVYTAMVQTMKHNISGE